MGGKLREILKNIVEFHISSETEAKNDFFLTGMGNNTKAIGKEKVK